MKFSIVIPSFNQGQFISKTLESIFTQEGDFSIEVMVFDAQSKDNTVNILKQYSQKAHSGEYKKYNEGIDFSWISEKDKGQTDAINKGLRKITGDIVAYINSDDSYCPGAFKHVANLFSKRAEAKWVTGYCNIIDENDRKIRSFIEKYKGFWLNHYSFTALRILNFVSQPATFWKKETFAETGLFDEKLKYTMDYDYWLRIAKNHKLFVAKNFLANFRIHNQSKGETAFLHQFKEDFETLSRHSSNVPLRLLHRFHNLLITLAYRCLK
jgi:glycosyltransferase involved in cell wall biosynthesis